MNPNQQQNNLKDNILEKIRKGDVKMYPKTYHLTKIIITGFVAFLVLISSSFLISFVLFSLQASGRLFLFGFGTQGLKVFLMLFPWHLLIIEIALLIILEILLRHFKFCYRRPVVYMVGFVLLLSFGTAIVIDAFPLHAILLKKAENKQLPMIGSVYRNLRQPVVKHGIYRGVVLAMDKNVFIITNSHFDESSSTKKIIAPSFVHVENILKIGDTVYVAGKVINGEFHTYGIQKIAESN